MKRVFRILVVAAALTMLAGMHAAWAAPIDPATSQPSAGLTEQTPGPIPTQDAHQASQGDLHHAMENVGKELGGVWALPFALLLLSIALCPLAAPHFWHRHFGKAAAFWALAFLVPFVLTHGFPLAAYAVLHTALLEYAPFLIMLFALFTITGGIRMTGTLAGSPLVNTGILALGTLLASWMGTTGASVLLIRPLLRANAHRRYRVHTVVFFIFLVSNIGGSLTPLGDPPLFLGFLKGVSFFWTFTRLLPHTLFVAGILLVLYLAAESLLYAREGRPKPPAASHAGERLGLEGGVNLLLLAGVLGGVLLSGLWKPGVGWSVHQVHLELQNICRDGILLAMALLSLKITPAATRTRNEFDWFPIVEVAKIFAGIFLTMIPALAILRAGADGALRDVIALVSHNGEPVNAAYFWLTGALSSFLDNAPTYLVFFNTAGGDPAHLMGAGAQTLVAISAGAVFMGANSYIGNAPNFMVRSIAEASGLRMPSFLGYMVWSVAILLPLFLAVHALFF